MPVPNAAQTTETGLRVEDGARDQRRVPPTESDADASLDPLAETDAVALAVRLPDPFGEPEDALAAPEHGPTIAMAPVKTTGAASAVLPLRGFFPVIPPRILDVRAAYLRVSAILKRIVLFPPEQLERSYLQSVHGRTNDNL